MRFALAFIIACAAVVAGQSCPKLNAQCDGQAYTGLKCCEPGTTCVYVSVWYSQCRAAPSSPTTTSRKTTTTSPKTTTTSPKTTTTSPKTTSSPTPSNPVIIPVSGGASGNGQTTRYWDCCKPSCGWPSNVSGVTGTAVKSCSNKGTILTNQNVKNACAGGGQVGPDDGFAYMCTDNQPIVINDSLAYGFAAANIAGVQQPRMCCACYELTFTSGPVSGQKMIVQTTNTGGDLGSNHFDIQMPGGGLGIFDGCSRQFGVDAGQWGQRYGGVTDVSQCNILPESLRQGCLWRFGWFKNADNPNVSFREVVCPAEITSISGCKRN